jgi:hypothetical protein
MKQRPTRTEDDLRAAFQLAAQDAPAPADVLAGIEKPVRPGLAKRVKRRSWGSWAPLAAVAVVLIAIVVPIVAITHNSSEQKSSASSADGKAVFGAASSAAAAAGPVAPGPGTPVPSATAGLTSPCCAASIVGPPDACTVAEVTASLAWTRQATGLAGVLTVTNHSGATCELTSKPFIQPLGADGKALPVMTLQTAEQRVGQTHLLPGASAESLVSWPAWCGAAPSDRASVGSFDGTSIVTVTGPTSPGCPAGKASQDQAITTGWFNPLS